MRFDAAEIADNLDEVWRLVAHTLEETTRKADKVFFRAGRGLDEVPLDHPAVATFWALDRIRLAVRNSADPTLHGRLPFERERGQCSETCPRCLSSVSVRLSSGTGHVTRGKARKSQTTTYSRGHPEGCPALARIVLVRIDARLAAR